MLVKGEDTEKQPQTCRWRVALVRTVPDVCAVQQLRSVLHWQLQVIRSWSLSKDQQDFANSELLARKQDDVSYCKLKGIALMITIFRKIHPSSTSLLSFVSFLWGQMQSGLSWRILSCIFLGYTLPFSQGLLKSQYKYHIVWMNIVSKTLKKPQIWCWDPVKDLQFPLFQ